MDTVQPCPSCGKPVVAGAPQGLCPECLMKTGFETEAANEPDGCGQKEALRVPFDRRVKLDFHGFQVTSDAGLQKLPRLRLRS